MAAQAVTAPEEEIIDPEFDFSDLSLIEIRFKVGKKTYSLREANGDAAAKYRNACIACTRFNDDGKPAQVEGLGDVEPLLVSLCSFDSENKSVSIATVKGWKSKTVKKLFEKAKEISELGEDDDTKETLEKQITKLKERLKKITGETAKNEQSDTTDGGDSADTAE